MVSAASTSGNASAPAALERKSELRPPLGCTGRRRRLYLVAIVSG
jgi:hypothetical protein